MDYLAVLGRQPEISLAELEALGFLVHRVAKVGSTSLAEVEYTKSDLGTFRDEPNSNTDYEKTYFDIKRLGGTQKIAVPLENRPLDYLAALAPGKITFGISDYSNHASVKSTSDAALKIKRILARHDRSVRIVENKKGILSNATSLHNGLSGKNPRKVELIKFDQKWYRVIGVQDIDDYAKRDQARPARDAKVGMLPPKLAQILINLCGDLPENSRILDPFCGTGVLLQEALLMGYQAYGTDINPRMIEYSEKNLNWLLKSQKSLFSGHFAGCYRELAPLPRKDGRSGRGPENELPETSKIPLKIPKIEQQPPESPKYIPFELSVADATNFTWTPPISAVACESYLGAPMSQVPAEIKLKAQKQECKTIILGFLRNLAPQIAKNTPVTVAIPAWLRENGAYERLKILDDIENLGYNVSNKSREGLLYYRSNQIVARDIIILRKK